MGGVGGSVFRELAGIIGATATVGVLVSSVDGCVLVGAGVWLSVSARVSFCECG